MSRLHRAWSYISLMHPFPVAMVVLATLAFGLLAGRGSPPAGALYRLVAVVLLSQICVGITNELQDLPLDRRAKPHKPLVSGQALAPIARALAGLAGAGALLLGLTFGWLGLFCAVLGTLAGLLYNYWLKGTPWSWLAYAAGFALLPLWPFLALDRPAPALPWVWLIVLPCSVALNLAQSLPDIESDGASGVRGLAQTLGRPRALLLLWCAMLAALCFAVISALAGPRPAIMLAAGAVSLSLCALAALAAYRRPGPRGWVLLWRCIAAAVVVIGIGWLCSVL